MPAKLEDIVGDGTTGTVRSLFAVTVPIISEGTSSASPPGTVIGNDDTPSEHEEAVS